MCDMQRFCAHAGERCPIENDRGATYAIITALCGDAHSTTGSPMELSVIDGRPFGFANRVVTKL